jgi:hypothetical protein
LAECGQVSDENAIICKCVNLGSLAGDLAVKGPDYITREIPASAGMTDAKNRPNPFITALFMGFFRIVGWFMRVLRVAISASFARHVDHDCERLNSHHSSITQVFDFHKILHSVFRAFSPKARFFNSTKGSHFVRYNTFIDAYHAILQCFGYAPASIYIF